MNRPSARGAFYVFSPARVTQSLDLWTTELPSIKPFYAVKCNPEPCILQHLYDLDVGFDCASRRELQSVSDLSRLGPADRIIYANPCKSPQDIQAATDMMSPVTVVDSVEEVEKLSNYSGGALVRIAVDDKNSLMPFSSKFGAEDVELIAQAAKHSGLDIRGVSFHVGSGCLSGKSYERAIQAAHKTLCMIQTAGHTEAYTIDIGGGYIPHETDFKLKTKHIRDAMMRVNMSELAHDSGIKWIAEPGRFFAENAFDFFVQVIGKKGGSKGLCYTIDDSLYGQFSSIIFDHATPSWVRIQQGVERRKRKRLPGTLFGRTCDSVDVIARCEQMEELEVGDWLWFSNMGAYTRATASEFNGFPKPDVFIDETDALLHFKPLTFIEFGQNGITYPKPITVKDLWE